jgi:hypothetical protein
MQIGAGAGRGRQGLVDRERHVQAVIGKQAAAGRRRQPGAGCQAGSQAVRQAGRQAGRQRQGPVQASRGRQAGRGR